MNPVRDAIRDYLAADATLTALLTDGATGVHYQRAPKDAGAPFVVFSESVQGSPTWTFGGLAFDTDVWLVKAVAADNVSAAEAIAARVDALVNDAPLTISGQTLLYLRRQSGVVYPEQDGAVTWQHRGALYRLVRA